MLVWRGLELLAPPWKKIFHDLMCKDTILANLYGLWNNLAIFSLKLFFSPVLYSTEIPDSVISNISNHIVFTKGHIKKLVGDHLRPTLKNSPTHIFLKFYFPKKLKKPRQIPHKKKYQPSSTNCHSELRHVVLIKYTF